MCMHVVCVIACILHVYACCMYNYLHFACSSDELPNATSTQKKTTQQVATKCVTCYNEHILWVHLTGRIDDA